MKRVTYKTKTCDLHGMTLEKAKNCVEAFINQCIAEDVKKAFIVTGSDNHTNNPVLCRQIPDFVRNLGYNIEFNGNPGSFIVDLSGIQKLYNKYFI